MSKYSIIENPPYEPWDFVLKSQCCRNFWQTIDYGEISEKASSHVRVLRLLALEDGKPAGIVQGVYTKYLGFGSLTVLRGPIINREGNEKTNLIRDLLGALEDFGVKKRIVEAKVLWPNTWGDLEVFNNLGYASIGKCNIYTVNLNRTVEDLWNNIDHNKRRNVKKALKEGVEVFETSDQEDITTFYNLHIAATKRNKFSPHPYSWFETVWKLRAQGLTKIFFARWNGRDISGVFTTIHGKTVYALAAGSLTEGLKVRPNDLLHWKVMEWAIEQGFNKYHMGFVSEPVPKEGDKSWNLWRWKKEWNGDLETNLWFEKFYIPRYKYIIQAKGLAWRVLEQLRSCKP